MDDKAIEKKIEELKNKLQSLRQKENQMQRQYEGLQQNLFLIKQEIYGTISSIKVLKEFVVVPKKKEKGEKK